jgi:DNA-directed RNA polymerase specialized sigma24 family protein
MKEEKSAQVVLQETFVKIWSELPAAAPDNSALYSWMLRIACRTAMEKKQASRSTGTLQISGSGSLVKN